MHDHDPTPEDLAALEEARKLRYDNRDLDFNKLGKWITGFFVFTGICAVAAFVSLWAIQTYVVRIDRPTWQPLIDTPNNLPKKAPLQNNVTAWKDIADLRKLEAQKTESYGVVNEAKGIYRVPVERAMEMVIQNGLPGPAPAPTQTPATPDVNR